jgi:hypothetical protein
MKHEAGGKGACAWGGQIAISIDEIKSHCEPIFVANRIRRIWKSLYFEKEAHLNRSATAKPTASPALKNRLFWFDLIRYGL